MIVVNAGSGSLIHGQGFEKELGGGAKSVLVGIVV